MSVLCQFYGSARSVLCQFYVSSMSVLCQFYVSSMSVVMPHASSPSGPNGRNAGDADRWGMVTLGVRSVNGVPALSPPRERRGSHRHTAVITRPRLSFALWLLLILLIYSPLNNFWKKKTSSGNIFIKQGNRVIWPSPRGPAVHVARRPKCKAQRGVPSRSSGASSGSGLARG